MRTITTCLLLFIVTNCFCQTELGVGLVSINFDSKTVLNFYSDTTDKEPIRTIEFFDDKSINSINIRNLEKQKVWLQPQVLWLDYSSFDFRCRSQTSGYYQVIVNNETGQTFWLSKTNVTKFVTWETYLQGMFGIERLSDQKQKIRKTPNDSSCEIKYSGQDCFNVKSMKGDWIEIRTADYCKDIVENKTVIITSGWIRWRSGNKLLIVFKGTM
jgi:hypothetical protein